MDSSGQTGMFNSQRGVSFLPASMRGKGGGEGFHAAAEERRKQEALAYDEHLTSQERYRRYHESKGRRSRQDES